MDPHKVADAQDPNIHYLLKEGESTPRILDTMTAVEFSLHLSHAPFGSVLVNDCHTGSSLVTAEPPQKRQLSDNRVRLAEENLIGNLDSDALLPKIVNSGPQVEEQLEREYFLIQPMASETTNVESSPVTERPPKRQCVNRAQFDEENLVGRLSGDPPGEIDENLQNGLKDILLNCDLILPEVVNSVPQLDEQFEKFVDSLFEEPPPLPRARLLPRLVLRPQPLSGALPLPRAQTSTSKVIIVKELTLSDIGINFTGIVLPKKIIERCFPSIPVGSNGLPITIHDGVEEGKTWNMKLTVSHKPGKPPTTLAKYTLKDTHAYVRHHSLEEGDWLKIFREEADAQCTATFEKSSTEYAPPSEHNDLLGKTWKVIIRKMLNTTDCRSGRRCDGAIGLNNEKVEVHLLPKDREGLPIVINQGGFQMTFYDWKTGRPWEMRLKATLQSKGVLYRLVSTAEFCRLHYLQKDDWVDILKSDGPDVSYALRAWKSDELRVR